MVYGVIKLCLDDYDSNIDEIMKEAYNYQSQQENIKQCNNFDSYNVEFLNNATSKNNNNNKVAAKTIYTSLSKNEVSSRMENIAWYSWTYNSKNGSNSKVSSSNRNNVT